MNDYIAARAAAYKAELAALLRDTIPQIIETRPTSAGTHAVIHFTNHAPVMVPVRKVVR